ncbi:hypothetical protein CCYA_CCYA04G1409 [Cyanidiococcus yangmingshanensis]|nr:hypothetical protein CCYA_CCYA04G1409 [Cyanidiococcus yangmingshanensis]
MVPGVCESLRAYVAELSSLLDGVTQKLASAGDVSSATIWDVVLQGLLRVARSPQLSAKLTEAILCCFTERLLDETPVPGWSSLLCDTHSMRTMNHFVAPVSLTALNSLTAALENEHDLRSAPGMSLSIQVLKMRLVQLYAAEMQWQQAMSLMDEVYIFRRHSLTHRHWPYSSAEHAMNTAASVGKLEFAELELSQMQMLWTVICDPYRFQVIRSLLCLNHWEQQHAQLMTSAESQDLTPWLQLAESQLAQGRSEEISKLATTLTDLVVTRPLPSTWDRMHHRARFRASVPTTWTDVFFSLAQNLCQGRIAEAKAHYARAAWEYNAVLAGLDLFWTLHSEQGNRLDWSVKDDCERRPVGMEARTSAGAASSAAASSARDTTSRDASGELSEPRTTADPAARFFDCVFRRALCATILSPVGTQRDQILLSLYERGVRHTVRQQRPHTSMQRDGEPSRLRLPLALIRHLIARRTVRRPLSVSVQNEKLVSGRNPPSWFVDYCYVATEYLLPQQRGTAFYRAITEHNIFSLSQYFDTLHLVDLRALASAPIPMLDAPSTASDNAQRQADETDMARATNDGMDLEQVVAKMIQENSFPESLRSRTGMSDSTVVPNTAYIDQVRGIVRFRETDKCRVLAMLGEKNAMISVGMAAPNHIDTTLSGQRHASWNSRNDHPAWRRSSDMTEVERLPGDVEIAFLCRELDIFQHEGFLKGECESP